MALIAFVSATLACSSASIADPWLWFYDYQSNYRSPVVLYEVVSHGKANPTPFRPLNPSRPYVQWLGARKALLIAGEDSEFKVGDSSIASPDGKTGAHPSHGGSKAKNSTVVRVEGNEEAPRSLTLGMIQRANRKVNPTGGTVHHIAWSPGGSKLSLCMTGSRWRDASRTCPEYLTYVWDLKSNQVRYIGPGFKATWRSEDRVVIAGYTNNLPGKFGKDLSRQSLPMFSALYTPQGQRLALAENMVVHAYSQSRGVFLGFSDSSKDVVLRQISPGLTVLPKWEIATKSIQWNAEFFYRYGITAR